MSNNTTNAFVIERDILAAALACAAKKDVRFYLNGVLIEPLASGYCVVATNGHVLFAGEGRCDNTPAKPVIIPREACEAALKTKRKVMICEDKGDGTYVLADSILFRPVEGTFPNWRRVVPRTQEDIPLGFGPLAPDVLNTLSKSAKELGIKCITPVFPLGHDRAAMYVREDYLWVAMPLRVKGEEMKAACCLPDWLTDKE